MYVYCVWVHAWNIYGAYTHMDICLYSHAHAVFICTYRERHTHTHKHVYTSICNTHTCMLICAHNIAYTYVSLDTKHIYRYTCLQIYFIFSTNKKSQIGGAHRGEGMALEEIKKIKHSRVTRTQVWTKIW